MTGQQQRSPRWKDCSQVPSNILPLAAGAIYVDSHFDSDDKREALVSGTPSYISRTTEDEIQTYWKAKTLQLMYYGLNVF